VGNPESGKNGNDPKGAAATIVETKMTLQNGPID